MPDLLEVVKMKPGTGRLSAAESGCSCPPRDLAFLEQKTAEQMMRSAGSAMRSSVGSYLEIGQLVRVSVRNLMMSRWVPACALAMTAIALSSQPAAALVVENMTGTTSAPADDPGWSFVSESGTAFTYLGNGWAISAFHVGLPNPSDAIIFNGTTYNIIPNQAYTVPNPAGSGLTALTDLRLIRLNGDVGTPTFSIASTELTESTNITQRQVTIVGAGPTREANRSYWNVTVNSSGPDTWTDATQSSFTHSGYRTIPLDVQPELKRWSTLR